MALNQQHKTDEKVTNNSDEDNHKNNTIYVLHKLIKYCAFLHPYISPSKILLFEEHQAFDTVFHHQMKHSVSCLILLHHRTTGKKT